MGSIVSHCGEAQNAVAVCARRSDGLLHSAQRTLPCFSIPLCNKSRKLPAMRIRFEVSELAPTELDRVFRLARESIGAKAKVKASNPSGEDVGDSLLGQETGTTVAAGARESRAAACRETGEAAGSGAEGNGDHVYWALVVFDSDGGQSPADRPGVRDTIDCFEAAAAGWIARSRFAADRCGAFDACAYGSSESAFATGNNAGDAAAGPGCSGGDCAAGRGRPGGGSWFCARRIADVVAID